MEKHHDRQFLWIQQNFLVHYEGLHHYAFTILKDNEAAKEAVQSALLKLWEKWDAIDGEQSIKSHLYTEVYDHCLNVKIQKKIKTQYLAGGTIGVYNWGNKNIFIQA